MRVLVVDDDALVRTVVRSIIERMGCTLESVGSGREALSFLAENEVDLVVSDFMMPEMSGEGLICAMRQAKIDTPVVVMTGGRTERIVRLAEEAGAFACLEKPINRRNLRGVLERVKAGMNRPGLTDMGGV